MRRTGRGTGDQEGEGWRSDARAGGGPDGAAKHLDNGGRIVNSLGLLLQLRTHSDGLALHALNLIEPNPAARRPHRLHRHRTQAFIEGVQRVK